MSSKLFIHQPVLAVVVSVLITLVGALAIPQMGVLQFPDLAPPTVMVSANYPGADAETVEKAVATQIEQEVNGAENMIFMQSRSTNGGGYQLTVSFEIGTNPDLAAIDVQNRVARANSLLPPEVVRQGITVAKQSNQILCLVSLTSPNSTYDRLYLSNFATINLVNNLTRVPGVGGVDANIGGSPYSMRLWLDPHKLRRLQMTANEVMGAISDQNLLAPAGSVGKPPQAEDVDFQYSISVKSQLETPEEFADIIIKDDGQAQVRVRDVGRVELGAQSYDSFGRGNHHDEIPILIYQRPGANALAVAEALKAELELLSESFPEDIKAEITFDTTLAVKASIEAVLKTLLEAFLLVVVVVYTFLGNFRATLIPLLAVPVSLIGSFAVLYALGFSINTLTLFGMVLAIGIVVDDAIVVVEAVEHHIEQGKTPLEATEQAMSEVAKPVVAIALVLCSVFVPVAFLGGVTGELYRQFAITLASSVSLSAVVALTLTPALCRLLLKPKKANQESAPNGYLRIFGHLFSRVTGVYERLVALFLRRLFLTVVLMGGVVMMTLFLHKALPTAFIPEEDSGYLMISADLPAAASLSRSDAVARQMQEVLDTFPEIERTNTIGGFGLISGNGSNKFTAFSTLIPWEKRKSPEQSAAYLQQAIAEKLEAIPGATFMVLNPPAVPGLGTAGGFVMEVQDRRGTTPLELEAATQSLLEPAWGSSKLMAVFSPFSTLVPKVQLDIDRSQLRKLGLSLGEVLGTLQTTLDGGFVNLFSRFGRNWRVYVQADAQYRRTPDDISRIEVRTADGEMVSLSTFARVEMTTAPDSLMRYNLYRAAEVYGSAQPGVSSGEALEEMEVLAAQNLPAGFGFEWTGTAFQEKQSAGKQSSTLALALLFVFLFLAAQYNSWAIPFSVLLGLPAGILGAYSGVYLFGTDNNVYVQIGIVTLMGLAAKNAILIVEFAKERYERGGVTLREAALEGAQLRFRPIVMTSLAFILGVLPLLFSHGASAVGQRALGLAVASGMTLATLLGVFVIPSLYVMVQTLAEKLTGSRKENP